MHHLFEIQMLGGLSVKLDGRQLIESGRKITKPWQVFCFLVLNRRNVVSNGRIVGLLWEDEEIADLANVLKNAVYSLRRELGGMPVAQSPILFQKGHYCWNDAYDIHCDIDLFDALYTQSQDTSLDDPARIELYERILATFQGDFLPQLEHQQWVLQYGLSYKKRYLECVHSLCALFYRSQQYSELLKAATTVTFIEPLDEDVYLYIFRALYHLHMHREIITTYYQTARFFDEELGVELCDEIKKIYFSASEKVNKIEQDILIIKDDLREVTRDQKPIRGAFFCNYETFKHMYQMIARSAERSQSSIILLLLTLTDQRNRVPIRQPLVAAMADLKQIIWSSLRKSDTFAQYSKSQYILMLPTDSLDKAQIVVQRIEEKFAPFALQYDVRLIPRLSGLDPIV